MKKMKVKLRKVIVFLLAVALVATSSLTYFYYSARNAEAAWYNDGWYYRIKLTIDHNKVTADQTDFPIYVDLSLLPALFHSGVNQIDARDIRVTKADGTTELPREVVFYDSASNTGELHFKYTGTLSSSVDTTIYLYYGNNSASDYAASATYGKNNVWTNSFKAAWHLSANSGTTASDSTVQSYDSSSFAGTPAWSSSSKVGRGITLNSVENDWIVVPDNSDLDTGTGNFTSCLWIKPTTTGPQYASPFSHRLIAAPNTGYQYRWSAANTMEFVIDYGTASANDTVVSSAMSINTWYFMCVVVNRSGNMDMYVNGTSVSSTSVSSDAATNISETDPLYIGVHNGDSDYDFDGTIDEVTFSNTNRSSTWISTQYNNQFSPSTFYSVSTNQEQKGAAILRLSFDEGFGSTTHDSSPNRIDGTLSGATLPTWASKDMCVSEKCLYYNGTTAYTNIASSVVGVQTVSFWVRPKSTTETLVDFDGGTHYISATSGTISATGFAGSVAIYVNGIASTTLTANVWQHIEVTTSTAFSASNITIGKRSSFFLNGFIDEFKIYDYVRSISQVKVDYSGGTGTNGTSVNFGGGQGTSLSQGLVGYWKMDETATPAVDSSGNGNNGTWTNSPAATTGKYGSGVYFDTATANKYITVPAATSINNLPAFTISTWVSPAELQSNTGIFNKGSSINLYFENVSGGLRAQFTMACSGGSMDVLSTSTDNISLNSWHHIAVSWDGTGCSISSTNVYIDGRLIAKHANSVSTTGTKNSDSGKNISLGNMTDSLTTDQLQGSMDETRLYNRALPSFEVHQLYNWAPGPVGYWNMDENTGQTLNDLSGNGHPGTVGSDGTVSSNDPTWTIGKYGSALNFDGVNDDVRVDDNDSLSFGNSTANTDKSFTFAIWVYAINNISHYFVDKSGEYQMRLGSDGRLICNQEDNSTGGYIGRNYSVGIPINSWHHVVCTYDGSATSAGTKIYLDGVRVDNAVEAAGSYTAMENLGNAFHLWDSTEPWVGKLDDVRIYNYVRTQSQILEDMYVNHPAPGTAVAYWKFNEGALNICRGGVSDYCDTSDYRNDLDFSTTTGGYSNSGKLGRAFNGTGAVSASRADDSDFDFGLSEDFSIQVWFKSDAVSNPSGVEYLVSKGIKSAIADASTPGYAVYALNSTGQLCFGLDDDLNWGPDIASCTSSSYYDGLWHSITAVRNTTTDTIQIYVDSSLKDSDTDITTGDLSNSEPIYIGRKTGTPGSGFINGDIDELQIFRSALTQDQIRVLSNNSNQSLLGATSVSSIGVVDRSAGAENCVPGDTASCLEPVGEWKMDDNKDSLVTDSSGNGYNSTSFANNTSWTKGKYGSGLLFDGSGDRVTISDQDAFSVSTTGKLSVGVWLYNNSFPVSFSNPVSKGASSQYEWTIGLNSTGNVNIAIHTLDGSNYLLATSPLALPLRQWQYVAFTVDNSITTLKVYINGVYVATDTTVTGGPIQNGTASLTFGERGDGLNDYDGKIDQVIIYNYVRTDAQIAWDYNKGAPIAWFKFDECQGTTIYNSAVNSNEQSTGLNGSLTLSGNAAGTCTSTTTTDSWYLGSTGKYNSALGIDGNDYVSVTTPSLPTGDFTYAAWVNVNTINNDKTILKTADGAGANEVKLELEADDGPNPKKLRFVVDGTSVYSDQSIETGSWYHIAGKRSGSTTTMYINGKRDVNTGSDNSTLSFSTCPLYIGVSPSSLCSGGLSIYFDGKIDDVRIYNYALSDHQIKTLMNQGSAVRIGP